MAGKCSIPYVAVETTRHGKTAYYFRKGRGPRIRLPNDIGSEEFKDAYVSALDAQPVPHVRDMPVTPIARRKQRTEATLKGALRSAKTRALAGGVPFDLTLDLLLDMAERQDFRCALTGIEFFAENEWTGRVYPYTPSIDRITPGGGYVPDNIRIIVYALNAMLLDWGEPLFLQIANSYRYWNGTKNARPIPALYGGGPHLQKKERKIK